MLEPKRNLLALIALLLMTRGFVYSLAQENAYSLQFSPRAGTILLYSLNSAIKTEAASILGKDISFGGTASGVIQVRAGQSASNLVHTSISSPGIQVTIQTADSTDNYNLRTKDGQSLKVAFSRTGRVEEISNMEALEEKEIMNFTIPQILRDYFPVLPQKPVRIGESWPENKRLLIPFQGMNLEVLLDIQYTLTGVYQTQAGQTANVSVDYRVKLSGSRGLEDSTAFIEGKGQGSGMLNFLLAKGYFTEYRLNYVIDASLQVRKADKVLLEWPLDLTVLAELNLMN
jgi:hypothetical protein